MIYEMRDRFPDLFDRYSPPINYYRVGEALASSVNDPLITEDERSALIDMKKYAIENFYITEAQVYAQSYLYCETCKMMIVGNADHPHCKVCNKYHNNIFSCGKCAECCDNSHCHNCRSCCEYTCENCDNCDNCCSCYNCDNCGRRCQEDICGSCNCCNRCCDCYDNTFEYSGGYYANMPSLKKDFNCTRTIGVEWEYNNSSKDLIDWAKRWNGGIHEDGSCGYEAVTPPISGDYISQCLTDLGKTIARSNVGCDDRCGIHVHVDASDYTWNDMYRLLRVYNKIEPLLYLFGGQHRMNNNYTAPVGALYDEALISDDKKNAILEVALNARHDGTTKSGRNHMKKCGGYPSKKSDGRYRGLNICPWLAGRRDGNSDTTVEFRIHRNSTNHERIVGWAKLCARIVDWTFKASDSDVDKLPISSLRALCNVIAPDLKSWMVKRVKDWRSDIKMNGSIQRRVKIENGTFVFKSPSYRGRFSQY